MSRIPSRKTLDLSKINFPTDAITFGAIRRHEPGNVEWKSPPEPPELLEIVAIHRFEQRLAEKAFAGAIGLEDPHPRYQRAEFVDALCDGYRSYKICKNDSEAKALAEKIEDDARRQALETSQETSRRRR